MGNPSPEEKRLHQQNFLDRTGRLLGQDALDRLTRPLVAIAGLGGVGGAAFLTLVRSGVRRFRLAENGIFDPPDMNRQWAALGHTMDCPKIEVHAQWAQEINPTVELELFPEGVNLDNMERFIAGADVFIGAIDADKGQELKSKSDELCARFGVPLFTAGALGVGAVMVNHRPGGMTPAEFWSLVASQSSGAAPLPSLITDQLSPHLTERLNASWVKGPLATCGVGVSLAGTMLGGEVLVHLLQDSGLMERQAVFAPRFVILDQGLLHLKIVDVSQD